MGRVHLRGGGGSVADSRLKPLLQGRRPHEGPDATRKRNWRTLQSDACCDGVFGYSGTRTSHPVTRSEEHTSELQSLMRISYAVFCLKKKKTNKNTLKREARVQTITLS